MSYLIKNLQVQYFISMLCYLEIWSLNHSQPRINAISYPTINKLSLKSRYFIRWARFRCHIMVASPLDDIKGLKNMLQGMNQPSQNHLLGCQNIKLHRILYYIYKTSQITNLDLFSIMNIFLLWLDFILSLSHISWENSNFLNHFEISNQGWRS